ncbi:hypothetical protein [Halorhodospira halochloris]|uniref:hypothetical protein n=1 Tax=Halorhodospira halochloris TaxID=1052 RepID=UPI00076F77D2|nr:hypothetical protein [Halorhodospira halochloris]
MRLVSDCAVTSILLKYYISFFAEAFVSVLARPRKPSQKTPPERIWLAGVEDAVNPSLEASWRHPWRQDLHTG